MGIRRGTNNLAKKLSCHFLLACAREKGCDQLQAFGDSLLVIKWINDIQECHSLHLIYILEDLLRRKCSYAMFSLTLIFTWNETTRKTNFIRRALVGFMAMSIE